MVLKNLLDKMQKDMNVLVTQKEALLEEAEDGLTRVNEFVRNDIKVDMPTGIFRGRTSHEDIGVQGRTISNEKRMLCSKRE